MIGKLRQVTQKNGATEAEERTAAEKIGRIVMASPEIAVGYPIKAQTAPPPPPQQGPMEDYLRRNREQYEAMVHQAREEMVAQARMRQEIHAAWERQREKAARESTTETAAMKKKGWFHFGT